MKVIRIDNYARETVAEAVIAENLDDESAKVLVDKLNSKRSDDDWYVVESDDYKPWRGMEELI